MNCFEAIRKDVQSQYPLHPFINCFVDGFCAVHIYWNDWKLGRRFSKLSTSQQIETFVLSSGVDFLGNYSEQMQANINFLLAMKCAIDLTAQYRLLNQSYKEFKSSCKRVFPFSKCFMNIEQSHHLNDSSIKGFKGTHLSRGFLETYFFSQVSILKINLVVLFLTICNIAKKTFILIYTCMITSACIRDVYLILKNDQRMRFRGCTLLFMNCSNYRQELESNCQKVYEDILSKAKEVDCYLKKFGLVDLNAEIISSNLAGVGKIIREQYQIASVDASNVLEHVFSQYCIPNWEIPISVFSMANEGLEIADGPFWQGEVVDLTCKINGNKESMSSRQIKSNHVILTKSNPSFSFFNILSGSYD